MYCQKLKKLKVQFKVHYKTCNTSILNNKIHKLFSIINIRKNTNNMNV